MKGLNVIVLSLAGIALFYSFWHMLFYGIFNVAGIQIPFTSYSPHAITVFMWAGNFLLLWLFTEKMVSPHREIALVSLTSINIFMFFDATWIIERFLKYGTLNISFASYFSLSIMMIIILYAYRIVGFNRPLLILLLIWGLSVVGLTYTNFWWGWDAFEQGIGPPPENWWFVVNRLTGYSMGTVMLSNKSKRWFL